jgi:hypothetical protein
MSKTPAKAYQPTEREAATLAAYETRRQVSKASPRWKVTQNDDGHTEVAPDHVDLKTASKLLMESLGTVSGDFVQGLMEQIANLSRTDGQVSEDQLNFMLAFINGMEPRNEAEAMLALQMATVHSATVAASGNLARAQLLDQYDSAVRAVTKLARTYTTQMETLKRFRSGGEQNVTVKHVHVHEGGQAIVGNVSSDREGVQSKPKGQSHAKPITHAPQPEMRGAFETNAETVPQRRDD